jgi:hypothetical protein
MKKILLIMFAGLLIFNSCQDTLEEEFKNPLVYSPDVENRSPGLFTNALTQWKFYIKDYGEWWWQLESGVFQYSGLASRYISYRYSWFEDYDDLVNDLGFQQSGFTWFNDYYTRMKSWGLIRDQLAVMEGQAYDDNVIYFSLTSIIKDWGALRNVDLYNSIPYKGAFQGTQGVFFVPYDDPKEIYHIVLDDLKKIAEELPGQYAKMSPEAKELLVKQDIALKGDINKWVQYANALRLRHAVMLSGVDADFAKTHIADAIKNLPQTDLTWVIPHVSAASDLPGGGTWQRGLYESAFRAFVPTGIINRMNFHELAYEQDIDDPRLPVFALPTKWNDYRGVTYNIDVQDPLYVAGERYYAYCDNIVSSSTTNARSMWSHVTYAHNDMPADMVTMGEIDLLLSEVALKGLATTPKSAGDHIKDAVIHSTDFWYAMNAISTYGSNVSQPWKSLIKPAKPASTVITSYAGKVKDAYEAKTGLEDKMEILMIQKQLHINLLRPWQMWGDLRRTRHPKLEKFTWKGEAMAPMVERYRYPSSEPANNTEFYLKVAAQDNLTTPIFWVPDTKKSETYYRNTDITFKTSELPDFN